jgi:hypothetical protein
MIYQVGIQFSQSPAELRRRSVSIHVDNGLLVPTWGFRTETHPDSVILFVALYFDIICQQKSHDATDLLPCTSCAALKACNPSSVVYCAPKKTLAWGLRTQVPSFISYASNFTSSSLLDLSAALPEP